MVFKSFGFHGDNAAQKVEEDLSRAFDCIERAADPGEWIIAIIDDRVTVPPRADVVA